MADVGRPLKFQTKEELQLRIDSYFQTNPKEEWTITGLACYLDTSRKVLMEYEDKEEFSNTIKAGKCKIEAEYERRGWRGTASAFAIFALKNFDWSDKTQQELTGKGGKDLIPPQPIINVISENNSNKQDSTT